VSDYQILRETITKLIDFPNTEWCITQLSADHCFEHLDKYEAEGRVTPKFFIEDRGVTLVWREGNLKTYHHFYPDEKEDEIFRTRT